MENIHETQYVSYKIALDGILEATYKKDVRHVDIATAREIVADRLAYQDGKPYFLLITEIGAADFSRRARAFFAGEKGIEGLLAIAILATNMITYFTANFILSIQKPCIPTRLFRDQKDARDWLKKEMKMLQVTERTGS